jgi:hypothetical protein
MLTYEIQYQDAFGHHAEAIDAWDEQDAVAAFRLQHCGESLHMEDVILMGTSDLELAAA